MKVVQVNTAEPETRGHALQLGDMTVMAELPPKMLKALAVIASRAHDAYDECSGIGAGGLRDKCLFASLAARDFLVEIGYTDATVRSCFFYVDAIDPDGKQIWSVGLGAPGEADIEGKFNGHAVCAVPSLSLLIDLTVYQAIRPHWCDTVSGMVAIKYHQPRPGQRIHGCPSIAGAEIALPDRTVGMMWLDRPEVKWKQQPDFRQKNDRRRYVTRALREAFGEWKE